MHVQSSVAGVELGRAPAGEEQEMNRPGGKLPQRLLRGGDVILKVTKMKSLQVYPEEPETDGAFWKDSRGCSTEGGSGQANREQAGVCGGPFLSHCSNRGRR